MPTDTIPVHLGRVNSRDESTLVSGELAEAQDAYYRPNDNALWKVPFPSAFQTTAESGSIAGLAFLEYDGNDPDKLLVMLGGGRTYRAASADGFIGTTAVIGNGFEGLLAGGATTLDVVHYNNVHYALNGSDRNRALPADSALVSSPVGNGATRYQGMLEDTTAPTIANTGIGTGLTLNSGLSIDYWFEERVKSGTTVLRRSASSPAGVHTLDGTGALFKSNLTHTRVNLDASHVALYGTAAGASYPNGAEISEEAIGATNTIEDTRTGLNPVIPGGAVYSVVTVVLSGLSQSVPRWGQPPIATTGDIFEDSMLLNDVADLSRVKYSFPDNMDAFPSVNAIRFETKEHDETRVIRRVGNVAVVLFRDSAWRINILPRPEDSGFEVERVSEQIDGAYGCVGTNAADLFSFGQGPRLAYVSPYGIMMTDGLNWDIVSDDVDWDNEVNVSELAGSILINNPARYRLEFYYPSLGASTNDRAMFLHYHPSHAKSQAGNFRSKVTWPILRSVNDAALVQLQGRKYVFTGASDGFVYAEERSNTDASGRARKFRLRTGDMFISDFGGETEVQTVYTHHTAAPNQKADVYLTMRNEGADDVTDGPSTIKLDRREHTQASLTGQAEAMQIAVENSDALGSFGVNYLATEHRSLGESEEG